MNNDEIFRLLMIILLITNGNNAENGESGNITNINQLILIKGTAENLSKLLSHSVSFIIYKLTWNVNLLLGQCHILQIDLCFC